MSSNATIESLRFRHSDIFDLTRRHGVYLSGSNQTETISEPDEQMRISKSLSQVANAIATLVQDHGYTKHRIADSLEFSDSQAHGVIWRALLQATQSFSDAEAKCELLRDIASAINYSSPNLNEELTELLNAIWSIDEAAVATTIGRTGEDPSLGQTDGLLKIFKTQPLEHLESALTAANRSPSAIGNRDLTQRWLAHTRELLAELRPPLGNGQGR